MGLENSTESLRILLVEDNENDVKAFKRSFKTSRIPHKITLVDRAEKALETLETDAALYDVVVIDHGLPGMNGLELCVALRERSVPLPLVMQTGMGSEKLAVQALKSGVDDYLVKDSSSNYLEILPLHLLKVVRNHRDRQARQKAEDELKNYHIHLERLVEERTADLVRANELLEKEITERKRTEEALRRREMELESQSKYLEEVNSALKVLLSQREQDKKAFKENVLSSVKELVMPYFKDLRKTDLTSQQLTLVNILESNLENIISPFVGNLASRFLNLTPTEIRVAGLIKDGKKNRDIAQMLGLSENTVIFHRANIRGKLKLKNKKANLRSYLLSLNR
ncbi:MAG: response regulator [Deltaproteobacteria bacterium]|nr:response regulator [Deltaproteobacteria bacterium]